MINTQQHKLLDIDKKLSLSFGLVILFVLLSVFFASILYFNYVITKEQNRYGSVIANGIGTAINSVSFSGKYQARLLIENLKKQNKNIDSIIIQDGSGLVIGHTDLEYNGKIIDDSFFQKAKTVMETNHFIIQNITMQKEGKQYNLIEIAIPYKKGYDNQIAGVSRVFILSDSFDQLKLNGLLYLLGLIFFFVILSYFLVRKISHYFSKPIKEQNRKLLEQKEEFETIFNTSKDGIAILDLESKFLDCNQAYLDMTSFSKEELLSKSCIELTIPEEIPKSKEVIGIVKEKGSFENFEKTCIIKNGETLQVNISLALLPDKERILISTKNVTGLKVLEQQAKLISMGEMIGNIAHQWRQPLSIISTSATGMLFQKQFDTLTDESFEKYCNYINDNAQYLSKTIDDFRNFIKGDNKKTNFNLTETIESFLKLTEGTTKNNRIALVLNLDNTLQVLGYPNELIQCFMNLFNNAKDALATIDEKDRFLFISTESQDDKVAIRFQDSGGGINENIIDKIFEPYFTTKHKSQGTGLGLHMTYKLITDGMKGSIEVSNTKFNYNDKEYKGVEFIITLPIS